MNSNNHITKSSNNQSEETVLKVDGLSKTYRLGQIGTGTISHDLNRWWAKMRGKEDPFATVGVANDRSQKDGTNEYVKVLHDINFEVKKGEVLGIIGKNGAGKSTLLKVISQITSPTTGSVKAKGRIASLLEVGTGMHPEMTGKENVYLNGTILGMTRKEIDAKFDEIMDFAGCAKYADTPVKRYSSGMKVRLGFAVAAFLEPEILIVDEVLAVGDAEFQKKAIGKMQDISKGDGRTVLFVSHNMGSVKLLCNRTILLENGSVAYQGETNNSIDRYLSGHLNINDEIKSFKRYIGLRSGVFTWKNFSVRQFGKETAEIDSNEQFELTVKYEILEATVGFRLFIGLYDHTGNLLGRSFFDEENKFGSKVGKGKHTATAVFQKDILIHGIYEIRIYAGIHGAQVLEPKSGVPVQINVVEGGKVFRKHFPEDFRGRIVLPVQWH